MSDSSLKPEILIIDDDSQICETLELVINGLGYYVRYFTNPAQGLEHFERELNPIVFLDVNMPLVSGLEVLPKIKAIHPKTQVLMMTGERDIQMVVSSLYHRATDFILKPFDIKAVESAIARSIEYYNFLTEKESQEEALARDMKLAARIQSKSMTLPITTKNIFAEVIPLNFVSGDFYQVLSLEPDKTLILVGDIEGHGVTSGLISILMTTVHKEIARSGVQSPKAILSRLNQELCHEIGNHSMTAISILVDHKNKSIAYAQGGYPSPILFKKDSDQTLILQENSSQLLGILDSIDFTEKEIKADSEDTLFIYSDGLIASTVHPLIQTMSQLPFGKDKMKDMKTEVGKYIDYLKASSKVQDDISYILLEI
jgi:sigma-B regulation protein RsbU (phosphoserine phosphatase)